MNKKKFLLLFSGTLTILGNIQPINIELLQRKVNEYIYPLTINIHTNSISMKNKGYGECNYLKNGEDSVVKSFIKKGDVVIDGGAHVGGWSKSVLDSTNGKCTIFAFEPVPETYLTLKKLDNEISCVNAALGKEEAELELNYFYERGSDCSSLFNRPVLNDVPVKKIKVPVISLDSFTHTSKINHINLLKIDTEGAELDVLLGAKNLINDNKIDIIQFEYGGTYPDANITLFEVYQYLTDFDYLIFRIIPNGLVYIQEWDNELENFKYSNYLAIKNKLLFKVDSQ